MTEDQLRPGKARLALYCVFSIYAGDDLSTALQLLDDIRGFFAKHNYPKRIFTTSLLQHLHELKDRPWSRYHKGKPLGPVGLRKFLRDNAHLLTRCEACSRILWFSFSCRRNRPRKPSTCKC